MSMKVSYLVVNGTVLSETRSGVESDYIADPLGSTAALMNSSGTITDTFTYWPYGQTKNHNGTSVTSLQFGGAIGYYTDSETGTQYVRARTFDSVNTVWLTVDPDWPDERAFVFCWNNPVSLADPLGLLPCPPHLNLLCKATCRLKMWQNWKHWEWRCTADQHQMCTPLMEPYGPPLYFNYDCQCKGVIPDRPHHPKKPPCKGLCITLCAILAALGAGGKLPAPYDNLDFGPNNCETGCEFAASKAGLCV